MQRRLHTLFKGMVQGVGFRYTTERIARRFPVTGFVKNQPNGQVELVVEGEEESIQQLMNAIRETFHSYIRVVDSQWRTATGEYQGFEIKF